MEMLTGKQEDYDEYVEVCVLKMKLDLRWKAPLLRNSSKYLTDELELYTRTFAPEPADVSDLGELPVARRQCYLEIQAGKKDLRNQGHANTEAHHLFFQWLRSLETMSAQEVKAAMGAIGEQERTITERVFRRNVNLKLWEYKRLFDERLNKATDKPFAISQELKRWEFILLNKADNVPQKWIQEYNSNWQLPKVREQADNIREGGCRPSIMTLMPYMERNFPQTEAKARLEYRDWLRDLLEQHSPTKPMQDVQATEQQDEATSKIIHGLNEYRFDEYHKKKGYNPELLHRLIREKAGREQLPYCIALMDETKYLINLQKEYGKGNKVNVHQLLGALFGEPNRTIKGQWLVLNEKSEENRERYKAHEYKETIKHQLKGHN